MNRISHWIDGKVVESTSGRSGVVFDPATGQQQAAVDFASNEEVDHAVAVAKAAFPAWRSTNLSRRAEVMFHMRELVDANRKEIASLISKEHGKVLGDALGEVARGLDAVMLLDIEAKNHRIHRNLCSLHREINSTPGVRPATLISRKGCPTESRRGGRLRRPSAPQRRAGSARGYVRRARWACRHG